MVEAKQSKLKEYYTDTTHHLYIKPSDESGKRVFVGSARCPSALAKDAAIRLNDTFRSNWSLAHPYPNEKNRTESKIRKESTTETESDQKSVANSHTVID